jgi:lipopolysaccharide transport protein LptA
VRDERNPGDSRILLVMLCFLLSASANVQLAQSGINVDGIRGEIDFKNNTAVVYKAVVTQGDLVLTADRLQLSGGLENGLWTAQGSVRVRSPTASIVADHADIEVRDKVARTLHFTGAPVKLQQRLADSRVIDGHADDVKYDLEHEFVYMTGHGYATVGATEFSAELITYDIVKGMLNADGSGKPGDHVKATIDPTDNPKINIIRESPEVPPGS